MFLNEIAEAIYYTVGILCEYFYPTGTFPYGDRAVRSIEMTTRGDRPSSQTVSVPAQRSPRTDTHSS